MAAGDGGRALGVAMSNPNLDGLNVEAVIAADRVAATLGFYGETPVVQPSSTNQATTAGTAVVSISATQWGFATSAQGDAVVRLVNRLRDDLVALGLIAGA